MKLHIQVHRLGHVSVVHRPTVSFDRLGYFVQLIRCHKSHGPLHSEPLQVNPQFVQLFNIRRRDTVDARSPVPLDYYESLLLQMGQRFSHWTSTHPERLGQHRLAQTMSRLETPLYDLVPQSIQNLISQTFPGGCG
jgi:hypothetical protein